MKYWMWIPAVLVITFVGDRLFGYGLRQLTEHSEFRYSRLYTDRGAADVVILGNSRGLTFYQPFLEDLTGKSTLNLSYNAMSMDIAAVLLGDYLDEYGAPERLILDPTLLDRDNPDLVRDFRVYAQFSGSLDSLLHRADTSIYYGTKVAHLTRYGGEVAQRMLFYLNQSDEQWIVDRQIAPSMVEEVGDEPYRLPYTLARLEVLRDVVERYEAAGTRVDLVIAPYYPAFARTLSNLDSLILDAQRFTDLRVYDYSRSVNGEVNFGDYQHLNKAGAEVFVRRLVGDLGL